MSRIPGFSGDRRGCSVLAIAGWVVAVILGAVLIFFGFIQPALERRRADQDIATAPVSPTAGVKVLPTLPPTAPPTATPLPPTATPLPTAMPPTVTPVVASMVAGTDGVNVRTGPGTTFSKIGYVDPGGSAPLTGRYGEWWQINYNGTTGWVFGDLVTASNAESVPQVQPPASPTPAPTAVPTATPTPADTPVPPTPTLQAGASRGIQVNGFSVEGAPGPFNDTSFTKSCTDDDGGRVWYNLDLTVVGGNKVEYRIVGAWVEGTDFHKASYTDSHIDAGERFVWRDCLRIPTTGHHNLWLRICYDDGVCENLAGPIGVEIK